MKELFSINKKQLIASIMGIPIFMLLYRYGKIPIPASEWYFQTAYGFSAFFSALFGPFDGALVTLIGYGFSDVLRFGSAWWSWVIAAGISGFIFGLSFKYLRVRQGLFTLKDALVFNLIQIAGNLAAWLAAAPVLDRLIYHIPYRQIIEQGLSAALSQAIPNILCAALIGTPLLFISAIFQAKKQAQTRQ